MNLRRNYVCYKCGNELKKIGLDFYDQLEKVAFNTFFNRVSLVHAIHSDKFLLDLLLFLERFKYITTTDLHDNFLGIRTTNYQIKTDEFDHPVFCWCHIGYEFNEIA